MKITANKHYLLEKHHNTIAWTFLGAINSDEANTLKEHFDDRKLTHFTKQEAEELNKLIQEDGKTENISIRYHGGRFVFQKVKTKTQSMETLVKIRMNPILKKWEALTAPALQGKKLQKFGNDWNVTANTEEEAENQIRETLKGERLIFVAANYTGQMHKSFLI